MLAGIGNPCQPGRLHAPCRSQDQSMQLETPAYPASRGFDTSTAQTKIPPQGWHLLFGGAGGIEPSVIIIKSITCIYIVTKL